MISLKEAKASGLKRYDSQCRCTNHPDAQRYVSNSLCVKCSVLRRTAHQNATAYTRRYYAKNKDRLCADARTKPMQVKYAAVKKYRLANAEKVRALFKKWKQENPGRGIDDPAKKRVSVRNRRARLKKAEGRHTADDITAIQFLQQDRCACCRTELNGKGQVDHIQAVTRGGSNWPRNLQILCAPCNQMKNAKDPIAFMQSRGFLL